NALTTVHCRDLARTQTRATGLAEPVGNRYGNSAVLQYQLPAYQYRTRELEVDVRHGLCSFGLFLVDAALYPRKPALADATWTGAGSGKFSCSDCGVGSGCGGGQGDPQCYFGGEWGSAGSPMANCPCRCDSDRAVQPIHWH